MKGADTMSKQDKVEYQIKNILSYWASRQRKKGLQFITSLPKGARGTTEQDEVLISGRRFFLIYTQIGQAIWTKVLVQEQGSGRIHTVEVQETSPKSQVASQQSQGEVLSPKEKS